MADDTSWLSYDDSVASRWDTCYLVEDNGRADNTLANVGSGGSQGALPGIAHVSVEQKTNFEKKAIPNKTGVTANVTSVEPCQVSIELHLHTKADHEGLRDMLKRLSPATKVKTYLIKHPMTDLWDVSRVYIESIDTPYPSRDGGMTVTINCFQWVPPKEVKQDDPKKSGSHKILEGTPL